MSGVARNSSEEDTSAHPGKLRVALVGPASSPHIERWAAALSARGCAVTVHTQHPPTPGSPRESYGVCILPFRGAVGYFLNAPFLRSRLRRPKPSIIHAHYLSGYATTARLSGAGYIVSVWGSDIFSFPRGGSLKRRLTIKNLEGAGLVLSTSAVMANEIRKYLEPDEGIAITPFGVDTDLFHPGIANNDGVFRVGMIKNLEPGCGGDTLIRAFAIFLGKVGAASPCRLMLAGDGSCRVAYEALARDLGIRGKVEFLGKLGHRDVPDYLRGLDAYCGPSEEESFGVAFLEAQATGLPVVATRVGGIPEVVADNDSAFLVAVGDHEAVADRLLTLFKTPDLRTRMGQHGRNFVESRYRWSASVDAMLAIYAKIAAGDSGFRE